MLSTNNVSLNGGVIDDLNMFLGRKKMHFKMEKKFTHFLSYFLRVVYMGCNIDCFMHLDLDLIERSVELVHKMGSMFN